MAKELTANFSANAAKFSSGVQKIKQELTNLNKSLDENKKKISETNKQIKEMEKEQAALEKAEKETGTATKEEKQRIDELKTAIGQAKVKVAELKTEQAELKGDISNATKALKEQKSGVSGISDEMGKLKTLVTGFIAAYGGRKLFDMLIGSNIEMEQYTTSLEVMLGSAEKASSMIEKMRQFAAQTPLTMDEVISNGTLLMNYGVDDSDLIDTMTKLGDLASGNAEKMDRIALAYGQMLAKGKVTGEELRQMTEAGVPLQTALAESIGVTGEEFSKLVSAGKVGIDDLNKAITELTTGDGKFAGMMQKQSETMQGMLSTLQDNVSEFFRKMGEGAFGEVKTALQEVSDQLSQWEQDGTLDEWAQSLGTAIQILVVFLKNAISVGLQFKEAILAGAVALGIFKVAIGVGNIISGTVMAIKSFTEATKAAETAQALFNATGAANPYVLIASLAAGVGAIIQTFIVTSNTATKSIDELKQSASELSSEAKKSSDNAESIEEIKTKYEETSKTVQTAAEKTQSLIDLQGKLNAAYGNTGEKIDLVNGKYEENIKKLQEATEAERKQIEQSARAAELNYQKMGGTSESYTMASNNLDAFFNRSQLEAAYLLDDKVKNAAFKIGLDGYKLEVSGSIEEKLQAYREMIDVLEKSGRATEEYADMYSYLVTQEQTYTNLANDRAANLNILNNTTENNTKKTNENAEAQSNSIKTTDELAESTSELVKYLDELASAYSEQVKNGSISYNTMLKLIDAGYAQCISLDNETGKLKLNTQAYKELAKAKLASQIADYNETLSETPRINSQGDLDLYNASTTQARLERDALQSMYDNFDTYMEAGSFSSNASSKSSSSDNEYKKASEAYKTEADKKIALIKRELEAKKELRDETIKAIDDEIAARKRLNEDNDMEKQINEVKAQLKYGQLDEFSREQMEKKLQGLYDDKAETEWQRNAQARKDAANAKYDTEQKSYNNQINSINESLKTVQQIMSAMADGSKSVESIVNNNNTRNNTANVNLIGSALTMAQITKAVKDALMDDIVIR